jgi:hypothetical protein
MLILMVIKVEQTSRRLRWAGYVTRISEIRNAYNILVGKSERKAPIGRPICRRMINKWILGT